MTDLDERARDRLIAAAQEARRDAASARRAAEELDARVAGLSHRVEQLTESEQRLRRDLDASERRAREQLATSKAAADLFDQNAVGVLSEKLLHFGPFEVRAGFFVVTGEPRRKRAQRRDL